MSDSFEAEETQELGQDKNEQMLFVTLLNDTKNQNPSLLIHFSAAHINERCHFKK